MKTIVCLLLVLVLNPVYAIQGESYERAMTDAMNELNQAATIDDYQIVANQFDRIAEVEKESWVPLYHAAYTWVMVAAIEPDPEQKDLYLDKAQLYLDQMEKLEHDNVERMALQGFLIMIRMSVDPSRGMQMGQDCAMILNQAYAMNNNNPRAVLMLGQFNYGSASYMGSDTSDSCAMFDTALKLFDQTNEDGSAKFLPVWGRNLALTMQKQCQE